MVFSPIGLTNLIRKINYEYVRMSLIWKNHKLSAYLGEVGEGYGRDRGGEGYGRDRVGVEGEWWKRRGCRGGCRMNKRWVGVGKAF